MFDVDLDPPLTHLDPAIEYTLTEDTLIGQKSLAVTVKQEELAAVASETISLTFRILKADDASLILQESIQIAYVNCFIHLAMPDLTSGIFEPVFLNTQADPYEIPTFLASGVTSSAEYISECGSL